MVRVPGRRPDEERLSRVRAAILVSAIVLAGALAGCAGSGRPAAPSNGQQLHRQLPRTVMDAALIDSAGRSRTLSSFAGKIVVISDMMTLCQETCPLDTVEVAAGARAVEKAGLSSKVEFVSVTVDPARDTPVRLAAYQRLFSPVPGNWMALTGSVATVASFWKALGIFIAKEPDRPPAPKDWLTGKPLAYDITHSDAVFFLEPGGRERFVLVGSPHVASGTTMPPTIDSFLNPEGRKNLNHPAATAWTLSDELQVLSWLTGQPIEAS